MGKDITIYDTLNDLIAKISESIKIEEFVKYQIENGIVNSYVHPGANLGALAMLETDKSVDEKNLEDLKSLSRDICMQIAVTNPIAISPENLDKQTVEKELAFIKEQITESGKPANLIEKISQGRINKFYQEVCLLNQAFIKDDKVTIKQHIDQCSKKTGLKITLSKFKRLSIGK